MYASFFGTSYVRITTPEPGNVKLRSIGHIMNLCELGEKKSVIEVKYYGHCLPYYDKKSSPFSIETSILQNVDIYKRIYRVSQEECARLRESVPYVKLYRYNPKHLCPK